MENFNKLPDIQPPNTCYTGYRTLVVLFALLEGPKSRDELNEIFLKDKIIHRAFSNDSVRIFINTLILAGCEISDANKKNNFKYILKSHPFKVTFAQRELTLIEYLKRMVVSAGDLDFLLDFRELLFKITDYIDDPKAEAQIQYLDVFKAVDLKLLDQLKKIVASKKTISFDYDSPSGKNCSIEISTDKITFENSKIYLWGYSFTHKSYSYFRVDKIKKINAIDLHDKKVEIEVIPIRYKLTGIAAVTFFETEDDYIYKREDEVLWIETKVKNEFYFMQKVLYWGADCVVLAPDDFRQKIIQKLKLVQKEYANEPLS